jgi:outer membrane protein OmpA-like peptidoglycan-associated protein/flagellar hook assembly protein FlgD
MTTKTKRVDPTAPCLFDGVKILALFSSLLLSLASASAAAVNQAELFYRSYGAPESALAGSVGSVDGNLAAGFLNPAGLATVQQLKFNTMFGDLFARNVFLSLSAAVPTRRGVLGLNGRYYQADSRSRIDKAFGGQAVWAKTFTDDLFFGLGFKVHELYFDGTNRAPQFGADAGGLFRHRFDVNTRRSFNLRQFGVGVSVLNIGNPVLLDRPRPGKATNVGMPLEIRLGGSLAADITKAWSAALTCDLVLANFTRFRVQTGLENRIVDRLLVNAGYTFNSDFNAVSLGLVYLLRIKSMEGRLSLTYLPWTSGQPTLFTGIDLAFGAIDTAPPRADFSFDGEGKSDLVYISPNYDGTRDTVTVDLSVRDNKALEGWSVDVVNDKGQVVRRYQNPDISTLKGKLTFVKIVTRMFEREKEAVAPAKLTWDGKDDKGRVVPDGTYSVKVAAFDENKNRAETAARSVVIDTEAPKADLHSDLTLFSPNGDGAKDTVTVFQNTDGEDSWSGEFRKADGTAVRHYSWEGRAPDAKVEWDGKDDKGVPLANGVYAYYLKGTDKAGNAVDRKIANITLMTDKQSSGVDADADIFSPNSDGAADSVTFSPFLSSDTGLDTWELKIVNESGTPVRTFSGSKKLTPRIVWDGTDENSKLVRDGNYLYRFKAVFINGDHPESFSKAVTVDDTPPRAAFDLSSDVFSPDGDGRDDVLGLAPSVSDPAGIRDWKILVRNELNQTVKTFGGTGAPSPAISWDGMKDDGSTVKGGEIYTAVLQAWDPVNNFVESPQKIFKIDAVPPEISFETKYRIFSPDGDGQADLQEFRFSRFDKKTIKGWTMTIALYDRASKTETPVRSFSGVDLPETILWDGVAEDGRFVQGGQIYKVSFSAVDLLANTVTLRDQFAVDSTPPYVELKLDPQLFSPDDDGVNDTESISVDQRDQKKIASWEVAVYPLRDNGKGGLFKRFSGTNALPSSPIFWNGLSDSGELVESAQDYEVDLTVRDVLNNTTQLVNTLNVDILIIKTPWGLKIRISNIKFDVDKATLAGDKTFKILDKIAKILLKYRTYKVEVEGHTDYRKTSGVEYNMKLSQNRAQSVIDYLAGKGVEIERLRPVGRGFSIPAYPNTSEENMAKNRRVEFLLYKSGWPEPQGPATNRAPTSASNRTP